MVKKLITICVVLLIAVSLNAEIPIKNKGYIFSVFEDDWYFQPCEDSSVNFFESLNRASFRLYSGNDYFYDVLPAIHNKLDYFKIIDPIFYNSKYVGVLKYQFCELEYVNTFKGETKNISPCDQFLEYNENRYYYGCFNFDIKIIDIKKR